MTNKRAAEVLSMAVTFNGCGRCTSDELEEAIKVAKKALDATEWISVNDRLPKKKQDVLTCSLDGDIGVDEIWENLDGKIEFYLGGENVTHWMPLPKPPKEAV